MKETSYNKKGILNCCELSTIPIFMRLYQLHSWYYFYYNRY